MNKLLALSLLVAGVVLVLVGFNATHSFASDVSRFFTESATNKAVWTLLAGVAVSLIGATMLWRTPGRA